MTRTVTATEAKNRLGTLISCVRESGEPVIVESRGEPAAVISSFQDFEELQEHRRRERASAAIFKLREIARRVEERNLDMTDEEAEAIADEVVRDAVQRMVDRGQIRFVEP